MREFFCYILYKFSTLEFLMVAEEAVSVKYLKRYLHFYWKELDKSVIKFVVQQMDLQHIYYYQTCHSSGLGWSSSWGDFHAEIFRLKLFI